MLSFFVAEEGSNSNHQPQKRHCHEKAHQHQKMGSVLKNRGA